MKNQFEMKVKNFKLTKLTISGKIPVVKTLIDYGAEINARTNDGMTPLHIATTRNDTTTDNIKSIHVYLFYPRFYLLLFLFCFLQT